MNNAEFECIQYISVNNALVLISVVSISDAVYIKQKALEFEICFSGDFSLFIMFFVCFLEKKSLNLRFILIRFYIFSNMHQQIKIHVRIMQ